MKPVLRFMMLRIVCCPFICKISLHLKLFLSALSIYLYVYLSVCLCLPVDVCVSCVWCSGCLWTQYITEDDLEYSDLYWSQLFIPTQWILGKLSGHQAWWQVTIPAGISTSPPDFQLSFSPRSSIRTMRTTPVLYQSSSVLSRSFHLLSRLRDCSIWSENPSLALARVA